MLDMWSFIYNADMEWTRNIKNLNLLIWKADFLREISFMETVFWWQS